jgi:glyoxylase-like metal-dependent hydrolase (beta-lactamase superfamily II)
MFMAIKRNVLFQLSRQRSNMHTQKIGEKIFQVDLRTGGIKNLIASYVLRGEKAIIVDCGPTSSIPNLLIGLDELKIKPEDVAYVAVSHVHADHSGGVGTLIKNLPNAKVLVHAKGAPHLINPARLWTATKETLDYVAEILGEPEPVPQTRVIVASEGMTFDVGANVKLKVVETPGHASHNLSYFEPLNAGLFPGDSAGAYLGEFDTVLPTTPPPFRPDIALVSIDKLISFNPKVIYYPHFGKAQQAINRLKKYAIQIGEWQRISREAIQRGESIEITQERMFREDSTIKQELREKILTAVKTNQVHRKTLLMNSVEGFVDFARKNQIQ